MLVVFLLLLPILLLFLLHKKRGNGKTIAPPGPPGLPFIGHLHRVHNSAPHLYLWKLSQKYGPLMTIRLGSFPTLVVSSAKIAKEVMKTHDLVFCSRPITIGCKTLSYNCLDIALSPYGEYWREMRKVCVLNLFSLKRVQSFRLVREDEVSRMVRNLSQLPSNLSKEQLNIQNSRNEGSGVATNSSKLVNLSEMVMSLTSTLICRLAFGKRLEEKGHERSRFHGLVNESQAMLASFFVSDYFPLMGWVDEVSGLRARLEKNFKAMDEFYQELIDDHLNPYRPDSLQDDFVDILLQLRKDQPPSNGLPFDHIKAVLMNIFLGGTDTGAATLIWTMTALIKNPSAMKKVQEEVRTLIGKKGTVNEEDVQKLQYLKAVIKEGMRMYPAVPLLVPRQTMDKCNLDGYEIKSQTLVYVNAWAIGRDPEAWENPEEFRPERFLNSSIDFKGQDFELIPFGAGRRVCPGISMGISTVELALANLLYSFDWEIPCGMKGEDIDTDPMPGITTHKKNVLCLVATNYSFHN